jgi:hypothetical protein
MIMNSLLHEFTHVKKIKGGTACTTKRIEIHKYIILFKYNAYLYKTKIISFYFMLVNRM